MFLVVPSGQRGADRVKPEQSDEEVTRHYDDPRRNDCGASFVGQRLCVRTEPFGEPPVLFAGARA